MRHLELVIDEALDRAPRLDFRAIADRALADLDRMIADAGEHALGGGLVARPHPLGGAETLIAFARVGVDGRDVITLKSRTAYYNPTDRYGFPSRIIRELEPCPGYTSRTRGALEAARDSRRHR